MTQYVYYILTVIGISWFITESSLATPFRMFVSKINNKKYLLIKWFVDKFDGVLNCVYCCSFWVGLVVYVLIYRDFSYYMVLNAFSVLGVIYIVKNIFDKH